MAANHSQQILHQAILDFEKTKAKATLTPEHIEVEHITKQTQNDKELSDVHLSKYGDAQLLTIILDRAKIAKTKDNREQSTENGQKLKRWQLHCCFVTDRRSLFFILSMLCSQVLSNVRKWDWLMVAWFNSKYLQKG